MTPISNVANPLVLEQHGMLIRCRRLPIRGTAATADDRPRDVCGRPRSSVTWPKNRKGLKPGNHGKRFRPNPPNDREMLAMLAQCKRPAPHAIRDYALFALMWRSGLRVSEALSLQIDDLDPENNIVRVMSGKGGFYGVCGMDAFGWEAITPWIALRGRYPHGPLFCICEGPTRGGRIGQPYCRTKLKQIAVAAGVTKRMSCHQLRHACAVGLLREGVDIFTISKQLRHKNIATTATYLSSIAPEEVIRAVAGRRSPVDLVGGLS